MSAFPSRYQPEAADARIIVGALWGAGKAVAEEEPGVMAAAAPGGANQGALEALRRVAELLTEDVIPMLSGGHGGEEPSDDDRGRQLDLEGTEPPEDGQDEPPADHEVPAAVTDAFEELYGGLSGEQAKALADLFAAVADAKDEGDGNETEPPDDDEEPPEDEDKPPREPSGPR